MNVWNEYKVDAYKYYDWFSERAKENNIFVEMSVCSINATVINGEDIAEFIDVCSKQIEKILITDVLNGYKVYMFAIIEHKNQKSKVERYMKVWKKIAKSADIEGFVLGDEMAVESNDLQFYTSTAEIPLKYFEKAMRIVISNPSRYALFISKADNVLTKEYIQLMFNNIIQPDNYGTIDYYRLSLKCCMDGEVGIRYGTDCREDELAFIYSPREIGKQLFWELEWKTKH